MNPSESGSSAIKACAVCGLILELHAAGNNRTQWSHAQPADHPPLAVPVESIRATYLCDFCLDDNARWLLPVSTYEVVPGNFNAGAWSTCDQCAELVRAYAWEGLVTRAQRAYNKRNRTKEPRATFRALYAQLSDHITGPIHPR